MKNLLDLGERKKKALQISLMSVLAKLEESLTLLFFIEVN
jgi:hypothetical protein